MTHPMPHGGTTLGDTMDARHYAKGWRASRYVPADDSWRDMDASEDRYLARERPTAAQHDAWIAGWLDYASGYDYGHAMREHVESRQL